MFLPLVGASNVIPASGQLETLRKWAYLSGALMISSSILLCVFPRGQSNVSLGVFGILAGLTPFLTFRNQAVDINVNYSSASFIFFQILFVLIAILDRMINASISFVHWSLYVAFISDCFGLYVAWRVFKVIRGSSVTASSDGEDAPVTTGFRTYGAASTRPAQVNRSFSGAGQRLGS